MAEDGTKKPQSSAHINGDKRLDAEFCFDFHGKSLTSASPLHLNILLMTRCHDNNHPFRRFAQYEVREHRANFKCFFGHKKSQQFNFFEET